MTLSAFATAVGSSPKWVQNAARILGRRPRYTTREAQLFSLVHVLHEELRVPLEQAEKIARAALAAVAESPGTVTVPVGSALGVSIDVKRLLSDFAVRLSAARNQQQARRRGRRATRGSALERARDYGIDIGLLEGSLVLSPAARLRRLDENQGFLAKVRRRK